MPVSLSKIEYDAAVEHSTDYIMNVLNCQKRIIPFDLIYGDGTIHRPLTKEQTKQLYERICPLMKLPIDRLPENDSGNSFGGHGMGTF